MGRSRCLIYSFDLFNLIEKKQDHIIGGSTVQLYQWYLVLLANNWEVSTFTYDKNTNGPEIHYIPHNYFNRYFKIAQFIHRQKPQFIIQRAAELDTVLIALLAKLFGVKFVYMAASDADFSRTRTFAYYNKSSIYRKILYNKIFFLGLKFVKYFVVQNERQFMEIQSIKKSAEVIKIDNIWQRSKINPFYEVGEKIIWVGNFRSVKRPELFIRLAQSLPDYSFIMIGAILDEELYLKCILDSSKMMNLRIIGPVSFWEIPQYYATSKVLVCTSELEGFPNTFLQAWEFGLPVLTTFDPDNVIEKHGLGKFCQSEEELVSSLSLLLSRTDVYKNIRSQITKYILTNHDSHKGLLKLLNMLNP